MVAGKVTSWELSADPEEKNVLTRSQCDSHNYLKQQETFNHIQIAMSYNESIMWPDSRRPRYYKWR